MTKRTILAALTAFVALAGCGGSSGDDDTVSLARHVALSWGGAQ